MHPPDSQPTNHPKCDAGQHSASPLPAVPSGPESWPPRSAWPAVVHRGVSQLRSLLTSWRLHDGTKQPVLLGVSGGADSLALAVLATETQRITGVPFGAIILDHQLQEITATVADRAARVCQRLGLGPVRTEALQVPDSADGLEAAARKVRYAAFTRIAIEVQAAGVLTAHTANDQAEQVLLALARGSGTRSLAGIRDQRTHTTAHGTIRIGRPLLTLTRQDTEAICAWAGISVFEDPMNDDDSIARIRVRKHLLPALADPQTGLGPGVFSGLVTTAALAADDAAYLDAQAQQTFEQLASHTTGQLSFRLSDLQVLSPAILRRVIALAAQYFGAPQPTFERLRLAQELIFPPVGRSSSAGPIQFEGHVSLYRKKAGQEYAKLLVIPSYPRG